MAKTTPGAKALSANIRRMRDIGRANARRRAKLAARNAADHLKAMAKRSSDAANRRAAARLMGLARRDMHNASLRMERLNAAGDEAAMAAAA